MKYLPRDSPRLILENDEVVHENGNIPKSATLALGMCLETLLVVPSVGQAFKQYSHEDIVMERMRDLSKTGVEGSASPAADQDNCPGRLQTDTGLWTGAGAPIWRNGSRGQSSGKFDHFLVA